MTTFRSEDLLVGAIALALLPVIGLRIARGIREGRLPLYRSYLLRDADRLKFGALLVIHVLSFVAVAVIAADLLLGLNLKDAL